MSSAVLRHAAPLLNIKAPIFAGLGAAGLFGAAMLGIALFGSENDRPPFARSDVEPAPVVELETALRDDSAFSTSDIRFVEPESTPDSEVSLSGVRDGFSAPAPAPSSGSDPADAETRHAAEVTTNPEALQRAPLEGLHEPGPGGLLPVISANGTRPSRAYARPFHGDPSTPTIAIVVGGMGMNRAVTEAAIRDLPPEVALSFAIYAPNLQDWIDQARAAGHEVLIEAPMEPFDYPNSDSGPHTLLADGAADENGRRLAWILSRATGYFGVTNYLGARFSSSEPAMTGLMSNLEERGLAFLHDGAGRRSTIHAAGRNADIAYAVSDRILDDNPTPGSIDNELLALEALALQNGSSLGSGFSYPATVDQIALWADGLDTRGYQLAPPSAVIARRRLETRLAAEAAAANPPPAPAPSRSQDDDHAASSDGH